MTNRRPLSRSLATLLLCCALSAGAQSLDGPNYANAEALGTAMENWSYL